MRFTVFSVLGAVHIDLFRSCFGQFGNAKHLVATAREPSLMGRLAERVSGETQEGSIAKISLENVTTHNLIFNRYM